MKACLLKPLHVIRNHVLATLPEAEFERLRPHLKLVHLRRNEIVNDAFRNSEAAHFIESGMISRLTRTHQDGAIEVASVGRFGFIGISVVLGTMQTIQRSIVVIPGTALRIDASDLRQAMTEYPDIREHLLKYVQILMDQKAQIALCNAKHDVPKRLARWLLLAQFRAESDVLPVTHDTISQALGVRRPSVTQAVAALETAGIIQGERGSLRITNVEELNARACACYQVLKDRVRLFCDMPHYEHRL